jgi:hypothetical protein
MKLQAQLLTKANSDATEPLSWELKFHCRQDGSLKRLLELFKGNESGVLVYDQEESLDSGVVLASKVVSGLDLEFDLKTMDKNDDETMSTIKLTVHPDEYDSKEQLKKRLELQKNLILRVLKNLGDLGNDGHSFGICFYPDNEDIPKQDFGWDGDDCDFISLDSFKKELKSLEDWKCAWEFELLLLRLQQLKKPVRYTAVLPLNGG